MSSSPIYIWLGLKEICHDLWCSSTVKAPSINNRLSLELAIMYMLYLEATLDNNNTTSLVHVQYLEAISVEIGIGRNVSYTVLNFHLQRVSTNFF